MRDGWRSFGAAPPAFFIVRIRHHPEVSSSVSSGGSPGSLVSLKITSAGSAIGDTIQIVSVTTECATNKVLSAEIVVFDGSLPDQTFPVSSGDVFAPGAKIGIRAGYGGTEATIFEGVVVSQSLRITSDNDDGPDWKTSGGGGG